MKKVLYLLSPGRLMRRDNNLLFLRKNEDGREEPQIIPCETVSELYLRGPADFNSRLVEFLGRKGIILHFFTYSEHWAGSFFPPEPVVSGETLVAQVLAQQDNGRRMQIARAFLISGFRHIRRNLKYYESRGRAVGRYLLRLDDATEALPACRSVGELMAAEGRARKIYYEAFELIIKDFSMNGRSSRPPLNEVNSLLSYGNTVLYAACAAQIHHTALSPAVGFLHEPANRRQSLALDLAEIYKPLIVDPAVFTLLNRRQLKPADFVRLSEGACYLGEKAKKVFLRDLHRRLEETFTDSQTGRTLSYRLALRRDAQHLARAVREKTDFRPLRLS